MKKGVSLFLLLVAVAMAVALLSSVAFADGPPVPCLPNTVHDVVIRGTVYNSTYGLADTNVTISNQSVNISIYNLTFSGLGEPTRAFVNHTTTNSSINPGNFSLTVASANCFTGTGPVFYTLEVVLYNSSGWVAREMGPSFPPLPVTVLNATFNNGNVYLQNASTLKLYALNVSGGAINFSYIIFDDSLGFPLAENFISRSWNATVVVPRNRNYTVVFMVPPNADDPTSFQSAVPPMSVSINAGQIAANESSQFAVNITKNLSFSQYTINGTINVTGNRTAVNVTNILVKLGLAGLMPPNSEISIPNGLVITNRSGGNAAGGYYLADYNVTVMGSSSGVYQVLEFYAANKTSVSGDGDYFAYLQNFTVTGNLTYNVVLAGLAGNFSSYQGSSSTLSTRFVSVNLTDNNGNPLDDAHVELKVESVGHKTTLPTFRYMLDQLSGGVAKLPILNTSNATVLIFNRRYAPFEFRLNITNASRYPNGIIPIKLNTFSPRRFNPNGTVDAFNSSREASNFRLVFMRNSAACSVYNASISACRLGNEDFDVGRFDPLKAMVASKVNIYSEINTTGVIIYFIGVDMIGSGPPEASMSDQPLREAQNAVGGGAIKKQVWRFGSVAPPIYDRVLVGIPYNESKFNRTDEYALFNISFDYLLDSNGNVIWNSTAYPNGTNIPDAYSDYAANWTNASSIGMKCVNETGLDANTQQCYVNTTTNYIWLNLPHFTDGDPGIEGQADTTPPAEAPRNVAAGTNLSSGSINISWTDIDDETGESYIVYRFGSNISVYNGSLLNITTSRVGEGVGSFLDNTTVGSNATAYYYGVVAVDSEGNLNTSAGAVNLSNSVNATVNDTIIPKSPTGLNVTGSGTATATLRWINVTQDVDGNPDFAGMRFRVYRLGPNATTVNLSTSNVSRVMPGATVSTVSTNQTTYGPIGAGGTGTYRFVVTSLDDGGNENVSVVNSSTSLNYLTVNLNEAAASPGSDTPGSSSSGGGGGGGAAAPAAGTSQSRSWDSLSAGSTAEFRVTRAGIPVKFISFKVGEDVTDVEVTVTVLSKLPSTVKNAYGGTAYSLLSVAKSNLKDTAVSSVVLNFSVEKKWLTTNSAKSEDILLVRYDKGVWNELPTTLVSSDSVTNNYVAESPGLSTFAIALKAPPAKKAAEDGEEGAAAAKKGNESQDLNESGTAAGKGASIKGRKLLYIAIALILLAAAGGIAGFFFYRKSRGSVPPSEEE